MSVFEILTMSSQFMCSHAGKANPTVPNPRLKVMGQPTMIAPCPFVIAGCPFPPPPAANGPCVSAVWAQGSARIKSNGMPVLIANPAHAAAAITVTSGTPLQIIPVPGRAKAGA